MYNEIYLNHHPNQLFLWTICILQEAQERLKELKVKKNKRLMIPDVDLCLFKNVPKDLNKSVKKDLKTVIMDNIHKSEKHKVIDGQSILSILPFLDKKKIVYNLCMASLRQVSTCFSLSNYRSIGRKINTSNSIHALPYLNSHVF
jgi:hypothetical protein